MPNIDLTGEIGNTTLIRAQRWTQGDISGWSFIPIEEVLTFGVEDIEQRFEPHLAGLGSDHDKVTGGDTLLRDVDGGSATREG